MEIRITRNTDDKPAAIIRENAHTEKEKMTTVELTEKQLEEIKKIIKVK